MPSPEVAALQTALTPAVNAGACAGGEPVRAVGAALRDRREEPADPPTHDADESAAFIATMQPALCVAVNAAWRSRPRPTDLAGAVATNLLATAPPVAGAARYTQGEAVFELLLRSDDVQLISLNWLLVHADTGEPLPRRQELPAAAFADVAALRAAWEAAPPHVRAAVLPIVSISYCWLTAAHPDERGEQLRHVAAVLKVEQQREGVLDQYGNRHTPGYREFFADMGVFWECAPPPRPERPRPHLHTASRGRSRRRRRSRVCVARSWCSIYQKDPARFDARETPEAKPEAERAAFEADLAAKLKFYGGAAYEASRTPEQKAAFGRALDGTMDVWCAPRRRARACRAAPAPPTHAAEPALRVPAVAGMLTRAS